MHMVETVTAEKPRVVRTIYCPDPKWKTLQANCKRLKISVSKQLVQLIDEFNAKQGSGEAEAFNLEAKNDELTKYTKKELEKKGLLEKQTVDDRSGQNKYDALYYFAISLCGEKAFVEDLPEVRRQMAKYVLTGDEPFSRSDKVHFIQYLDYVLKRRKLAAEIEAHLLADSDQI